MLQRNRKDSKRTGSHAQFPGKLHNMMEYVEQEGLESTISWALNGRGFMIHDPDKLVGILPLFFGQTKYRSFRRQLNMWHFERILVDGPNKGAFLHPYFVRDNKELCECMSRLAYNTKPTKAKTEKTPTKEKKGNTPEVLKNDDFFEATGNKNLDCQNNNNIPTNIPSLYKGTIPTLSSVLHNTKIHNNEPSKESSSWSHDDLTPLSLDCQDQKETLHVALTDLTDWLQSEKQAQAHFLKEETIEELLPYHTSIEDDIPSADTLISLFDATDRRMDMNDYDFELFP